MLIRTSSARRGRTMNTNDEITEVAEKGSPRVRIGLRGTREPEWTHRCQRPSWVSAAGRRPCGANVRHEAARTGDVLDRLRPGRMERSAGGDAGAGSRITLPADA